MYSFLFRFANELYFTLLVEDGSLKQALVALQLLWIAVATRGQNRRHARLVRVYRRLALHCKGN